MSRDPCSDYNSMFIHLQKYQYVAVDKKKQLLKQIATEAAALGRDKYRLLDDEVKEDEFFVKEKEMKQSEKSNLKFHAKFLWLALIGLFGIVMLLLVLFRMNRLSNLITYYYYSRSGIMEQADVSTSLVVMVDKDKNHPPPPPSVREIVIEDSWGINFAWMASLIYILLMSMISKKNGCTERKKNDS